VIVDILGVPSEVSLQRDVNKRLILLGEKGSERIKKQVTLKFIENISFVTSCLNQI